MIVTKKGGKMQKIFLISFVIISFSSLFSTASKTFNIDQNQLNSIEKKFGTQGKNRVEEWYINNTENVIAIKYDSDKISADEVKNLLK